MSVVRCPVDISASGRSLVQRSPTEFDVPECDRETSFDEDSTNQGCPIMIIYIIRIIRIYIYIYIYIYSYYDYMDDFIFVVCSVLYFQTNLHSDLLANFLF